MAWTFNTPMATLSDAPTVQNAEQLWEKESLGGLTEDNNPIPVPVIWLVFLTVCTAFFVTFPLWGQRPTAALYAPFVNAMSDPGVLAAKDDAEAMKAIQKLVPNSNGKDTLLVHCDHLDIVGHYHDVRSADKDSPRRFQAYDLLKSDSGFDAAGFARVWNDVFDFCVSGSGSTSRRR